MHGAGFCAFGSAAWDDVERSTMAIAKLENRIAGPFCKCYERFYGLVVLPFIDESSSRRAVSCSGGF